MPGRLSEHIGKQQFTLKTVRAIVRALVRAEVRAVVRALVRAIVRAVSSKLYVRFAPQVFAHTTVASARTRFGLVIAFKPL